MTRACVTAILLILILLPSCRHEDHHETSVLPPAPGPRTFLFGMRSLPAAEGQFVATTSDPAVLARLEAQLALPGSERFLHMHGHISRGNEGNLSWHWHFVPDQWDVVEMSMEICDGGPGGVENDLDVWVDQLGIFCPWGSYVQGEI